MTPRYLQPLAAGSFRRLTLVAAAAAVVALGLSGCYSRSHPAGVSMTRDGVPEAPAREPKR